MERIDCEVIDCLLGRPHGFLVDDRQFYIYPMTLGKMHLLQCLIEELGMNVSNLQTNDSFEVLRLAREKKKTCLSIIAYSICKNKDEVFDSVRNNENISLFAEKLSDEDIATLMILVFSQNKTDLLFEHFGIDKEQKRIQKIMEIKSKNDKSSITTGGLSVFGNLLDAACERYGWTKEYVVWGIDYASLRLMLSDKVNTIFLTDDERKRVPASLLTNDCDTIKATKENMERIKAMGWK